MQPNRPPNHLHYGDNLAVLREQVDDASVDLVYLDPPFNSNATYNILFRAPDGGSADAQIEAFEDSWHWNDAAEDAFDQVARSGNTRAFDLLNAMRAFLGENDMMAYLAMMAVRLLELHRVLKPTGSLYLHCDPTASHYLKLLLDGVFGVRFYRNEIVWKRTSAHGNVSAGYGDVTDTIFYYTRGLKPTWNRPMMPLSQRNVAEKYTLIDSEGRRYTTRDLRNPGVRPNLTYDFTARNGVTYKPHPNGWSFTQDKMRGYDEAGMLHYPRSPEGRLRLKLYLDESAGQPQQTLWDDISPLNSQAQERLGYPTQKPLALLERIIAASSNPGDTVLDPFCGCGTAVHAAQKLDRRWIGIDVTHLAITLVEKRLRDAFPDAAFTVEGTPKDLASALDLARRDKYQFQWWAVSMIDAMPFGGKKKGADGGVDGVIYFKPDGKRTAKAIVSVKGGTNVGVQMIRDLHSAMEREGAPIGIFLTAALPTSVMEREAAAVGRVHAEATGRTYPRLQIITLAELFAGKRPDIPLVDPHAAFRRAGREEKAQARLL